MIDLVFPGRRLTDLRERLLESSQESCAVAFTNAMRMDGRRTRLLVTDVQIAIGTDYVGRGAIAATLRPEYVAALAKRARLEGRGLVFIHTHPQEEAVPTFSVVDDEGEVQLAAFLRERQLTGPHAALVIGNSGVRARLIGGGTEIRVSEVGHRLSVAFDPERSNTDSVRYDRQIRAFGAEGQVAIERLAVGIVGLGGTGSVVAQQLAYLGVKRFTLVDFDVVDETNLNRLVGARPVDRDRPKVDVAARQIRAAAPSAQVRIMRADVTATSAARALLGVDFLFGCTDSQASRAVLQQLSYQYYLPCIDMGASIVAKDGRIEHIAGRVQLLAPGLPCLTCLDLLDGGEIRRELMTPEQRKADPYFIGNGEPRPAVVSLNAALASLAVTMFLGVVTSVPAGARHQIYNGIAGTVRAVAGRPHPACIVCSAGGSLGQGNTWPLPTRDDT